MGHCNMLLAVAGLDKHAIGEHTQDLASGDWSRFTPAEQTAFAFARKFAKNPAIPAQDMQELVDRFGQERALDVIWWVCHCQYMTRVADALQLPLERGNVFDGFQAVAEGP
jgi:hypothetical protein